VLEFARPTSGLGVSGLVLVEARATDNLMLKNFRFLAPASLVSVQPEISADGRKGVLRATLDVSAVADGPLMLRLGADDALGNFVEAELSVVVDSSAPGVTVVTAPPRYTGASSVAFTVSADDGTGSGVNAVYAQVEGDARPPTAGTRGGDGVWRFSALPLHRGFNSIAVWAEDNASANGDGRPLARPAKLSLVVVQDAESPAPVVVAAEKMFQDEDQLQLVMGAEGPVVPVQYRRLEPVRSVTTPEMTIKRAATRLSDPDNQPTLMVAASYNEASDAPIVSATWRTQLPRCPFSQPNCEMASRTLAGALVEGQPKERKPNNRYFALPLSLPQTGSYVITLSVTDAAGNIGSVDFKLSWEIVGPPVVVVRDTAWDSSGDPQALQNMRLSDSSYGGLFGSPTKQLLFNETRIARFTVYNPAPEPVVVAVAMRGHPHSERRTIEKWNNQMGSLYGAAGGGTFVVDRFTFYRDFYYSSASRTAYCSAIARDVGPYPCPITETSLPYPIHYRFRVAGTENNPDLQYQCFGNYRLAPPPYYGMPAQGAHETFLAQQKSNQRDEKDIFELGTQWVVPEAEANEAQSAPRGVLGESQALIGGVIPAAKGTTPGSSVFYVVAPATERPWPLSKSPLPHLSANGKYLVYYADIWDIGTIESVPYPPKPASADCSVNQWPVNSAGAVYWYRQMEEAHTDVKASFDVYAGGQLGAAADASGQYFVALSGSRAIQVATTLSRSVSH
jgi:hypothetical protein